MTLNKKALDRATTVYAFQPKTTPGWPREAMSAAIRANAAKIREDGE